MTNTIGALDVALTANTAAFTAGTARARRDLSSFSAQTNSALASVDRAFTRSGAGINALIARYTTFYAVLRTGQRLVLDVAQTNTEAGREAAVAVERLNKAWLDLGQQVMPYVTPLIRVAADIMKNTAKEIEGIVAFVERAKRAVGVDTGNYRGPGGIPLKSAMNPPDSVAVTAARRSALGDIMAGDTMINASLADFTARGFESAAGSISAQRGADMRYRYEQSENAKYLKELASSGIREALEETQRQAVETKAALLDMSSALVFGAMRGGNAIGFVIDQLAMMIIQTRLLKPLIDSLDFGGGGGGGLGGFLSAGASWLFGGGGGALGAVSGYSAASDLYRHSGGPVSAGHPYIVRPDEEVFIPGTSGRVEPMGGGLTVNVDARGSSLTAAQVEAAVVRGVEVAVGASVGIVANRTRSRGGRF